MAYTYSSWQNALSILMVQATSDSNFQGILPSIIDYAEQRIYRELDLLSTVVRDTTGSLTANSRDFVLPVGSQGKFVVTNGINVFTPVGTTTKRNPMVPTSRDFIDLAWPSAQSVSTTDIPSYFAMIDDQHIIVGKPPGANFTVEVIGTIRPTPLSGTNPSTFLTQYLPDLWMAATMIFASGYQKNFGSQADQPQMAQSWESQYQLLKSSADLENMRKKWQATNWTSQNNSPFATPPRS